MEISGVEKFLTQGGPGVLTVSQYTLDQEGAVRRYYWAPHWDIVSNEKLGSKTENSNAWAGYSSSGELVALFPMDQVCGFVCCKTKPSSGECTDLS